MTLEARFHDKCFRGIIGKNKEGNLAVKEKMRCEDCPFDMTKITEAYYAMKDPSKDYQLYLLMVKKYFEDYCLRQVYFVCAKLSIREYYPEKSHIIEPYKSEQMSMKDLDIIINQLEVK